MFPYNEDEWLWLSARKTLQGEIRWRKKSYLKKTITKLLSLLR